MFNGDNYSAEWVAEAEKRGLPILRTVPEALAALVTGKNMQMFERYGVFTRAELLSRHEVYFEEYCTRSRIEGELALTMARTLIRPSAAEYRLRLVRDLQLLQQTGIQIGQAELVADVEQIGKLIAEMVRHETRLEQVLPSGDSEEIREAQAALRVSADRLEKLVDDELWPLPKYREMLFIY
ncbi:Glutamine synthetase [bioreactor metagenome]|uniref:Glutamine synthetase n=1 Tax=bioreactor metagenome TaxID=1076179 RepID=A0A645IBM0_9ZZZZ